jgi:hypothetical protein
MAIYKFRTHNLIFSGIAFAAMALVPILLYVSLNGEPVMTILAYVGYYYFLTQIIFVEIFDDGMLATWILSSKKIKKKITWQDMESFATLSNSKFLSEELIIKTKQGERYNIYFYVGFKTISRFQSFIEVLETRIKRVPASDFL